MLVFEHTSFLVTCQLFQYYLAADLQS